MQIPEVSHADACVSIWQCTWASSSFESCSFFGNSKHASFYLYSECRKKSTKLRKSEFPFIANIKRLFGVDFTSPLHLLFLKIIIIQLSLVHPLKNQWKWTSVVLPWDVCDGSVFIEGKECHLGSGINKRCQNCIWKLKI